MATTSRTLTTSLFIAMGATALAGCAQPEAHSDTSKSADEFSTGLTELEARDRTLATNERSAPPDLEQAFRDNAAALEQAMDPDASGPPPEANLEPSMDLTDEVEQTATPAQPLPTPALTEATNEAEDAPQAEPESPSMRRERLVAELAAVIREEHASEVDPVRRETMLAALTLLSPTVTHNDSDLVERERKVLEAWRALFADVREGMRGSAGDLQAIPRAAEAFSDRLANEQPLTITDAQLCARVEGFGRYRPLPTRLLAGRAHPAIVYTEVDHFGTRAGAGPDGEPGHTVELSQELALYHDADGLLAWRRPEQAVTDFSRNRRRDFFIVQRIDLPQTLTVGMYRLKVTVHDRVTGETAETIIPIEVVADAALIRRGR